MGEARTIELATADGPMAVLRGADRTGRRTRCGHRRAGGVRRERPHRGRHPPLRRPRATTRSRRHFFHRAGGGTAPYDDFAEGDPALRGPHRRRHPHGRRRRRSRHLRGAGFTDGRIGIVGLLLRRPGHVPRRGSAGALGAAVGFYGGGIVNQPGSRSSRRWSARRRRCRRRGSGSSATRTAAIPVEEVEAAARRARAGAGRRPRSSATRTPSTASTATCAESYHEAAAQDAWPRTLAWFGEPPRGGAVTDAVEFAKADDCDLCEAARITPWFHEDDVCWIAECEICDVADGRLALRTAPSRRRRHLEHMHGGAGDGRRRAR